MCTTFLGALLARRLAEAGYEFVDYPYLVRLNPNIPFKTRGNGSVSLHVRVEREDLEVIEELVKSYVERLAERHGKTDATAVLVVGSAEPLREVYRRALVELVSPYSVRRLLKAVGARVIGGRKRGVVGAAASIGAYPLHSYTYELLLYRPLIARERCRGVEDYVEELDRLLRPYIFANVDYATGRVLATPHGPDPVIAGIRSVNPLLLSALAPRLCEAWGALMAIIYKSNQATGQHLTLLKSIADVRPYDSVVVKGRVASSPAVIKGGHVIFSLEDSTGRVE
ncbi:MAG: tRNA(Ile2) 2-agmatinylcytidine synthetase, partial [Thermoprotei archaeon]